MPMAGPFTAATSGFWMRMNDATKASRMAANCAADCGVTVPRLPRSLPDENHAPAPVTTTARTASSLSAETISFVTSRNMSRLNALNFCGLGARQRNQTDDVAHASRTVAPHAIGCPPIQCNGLHTAVAA